MVEEVAGEEGSKPTQGSCEPQGLPCPPDMSCEAGVEAGNESWIELQKLQEELVEYKRKYLEALAEGENSRKRLQKERQELVERAIREVIIEFLLPIDQLDHALGHAEKSAPEVRNWAIGFEMILSQFKNVLGLHGVTPFVSEGKPFDPHYHEAIELVETDEHPPGIVVQEKLSGYLMGGSRVLRPARVVVSGTITPANGKANVGQEGDEQPIT